MDETLDNAMLEVAENVPKVYESGHKVGYEEGYNKAEKENPLYYAREMAFTYTGRQFSDERSNVVCRFLDCAKWNMTFGQLSGIKTLKIICDTQGLTVGFQALVRESADLEILDLTEFNCYPNTIAYFAYQSKKLVSIYGAFDLSQCTTVTSAFAATNALEDIEFVPNTIKLSMSFKDCWYLTKASLTSIINGLNSEVEGQTLTVYKKGVNNAFETAEGLADGSTSEEWTNLIANKPNWTISLG